MTLYLKPLEIFHDAILGTEIVFKFSALLLSEKQFNDFFQQIFTIQYLL